MQYYLKTLYIVYLASKTGNAIRIQSTVPPLYMQPMPKGRIFGSKPCQVSSNMRLPRLCRFEVFLDNGIVYGGSANLSVAMPLLTEKRQSGAPQRHSQLCAATRSACKISDLGNAIRRLSRYCSAGASWATSTAAS